MNDSQPTFSNLITRLDYASSRNFISIHTPKSSIPAEFEIIWRETREKFQIDAIYFVANAPVIYFKRFETFNREDIADLHRNVWSQSQVPLIFVVMPNDIRIYSGYEVPALISSSRGLKEPTRLESKFNQKVGELSDGIWERLEIFTRTAIESGSFWRDYSQYFRKETRVDRTLLANLRYIRQELIKIKKLRPEHAHSLIGRSIFALYLQDRGVLSTDENSFFAERYKKSNYTCYTDLLTSYEHTYDFFEFLHGRFNGDMFPVTEEEKEAVTLEHLVALQKLFTVDQQTGGQMLFFWAYNFKFVPIELISSIYEEFLHQEESGKNGAYYTPPMLVEFMLNQTMPWTDTNYKLRLLDPACGSGIFLVEAYRRLVERWRTLHGPKISFKILAELLTASIHGIDINRQALRVAAFSLYLAMLDYLEPKSIWMDVHFSPLLGTNLIEGDFFDEKNLFNDLKFDLIIGNPPWESRLTAHAQNFLLARKASVGDKQIVQAFLLHAPDFCDPDGQIALLCSSKSILFNRSRKNIAFRNFFFKQFNVKTIFDFSALRRSLFEKGIAPAAAVFYTLQKVIPTGTIFYGAPKPTSISRPLAAIIIEASDLKQIPIREVWHSIEDMERKQEKKQHRVEQKKMFFCENSGGDELEDDEASDHAINIWKVALWGTSHDHILLQVLNNYPSLREVIKERNWYSKGGFNRSGPGKLERCLWLDNAYYLETKDLVRYGIDPKWLENSSEGNLYYRGGDPARFKGPLMLFKRGQAQRRPSAAYLNIDCTYADSITGIAGPVLDSELLKALTALLNSELAQYYLFLTSASWGVEREEIKAGELRSLPFPFLEIDNQEIQKIAELVDNLAEEYIKKENIKKDQRENTNIFIEKINEELMVIEKEIGELEVTLDNHIYACFHLSEQEIRLIRETVEYTIGFFNSPDGSLAQKKPTIEMRMSYAKAYIEAINFYLEPVGKKMVAIIYDDETAPLLINKLFSVNINNSMPEVQICALGGDVRRVLFRLQRVSDEPIGRGIFHRRSFRLYDKIEDALFVIKPAEQRLWTTSAALSDAEETVIEMLHSAQTLKV